MALRLFIIALLFSGAATFLPYETAFADSAAVAAQFIRIQGGLGTLGAECDQCLSRFRNWSSGPSITSLVAGHIRDCESLLPKQSSASAVATLQNDPQSSLSTAAFAGIKNCQNAISTDEAGRYFYAVSSFDSAADQALQQMYNEDALTPGQAPLAGVDCKQFSQLKNTQAHCETLQKCSPVRSAPPTCDDAKKCLPQSKLDHLAETAKTAAADLADDEKTLADLEGSESALLDRGAYLAEAQAAMPYTDEEAKQYDAIEDQIHRIKADEIRLHEVAPAIFGDGFKNYIKRSPSDFKGAVQAQLVADRNANAKKLDQYANATRCVVTGQSGDGSDWSCRSGKLNGLIDDAPAVDVSAMGAAAAPYFSYGQCTDDARLQAKEKIGKNVSYAFWGASIALAPFTLGASLEADAVVTAARAATLVGRTLRATTAATRALRATSFGASGAADLFSDATSIAYATDAARTAAKECAPQIAAVTNWRAGVGKNICLDEKADTEGSALEIKASTCTNALLRATVGVAFGTRATKNLVARIVGNAVKTGGSVVAPAANNDGAKAPLPVGAKVDTTADVFLNLSQSPEVKQLLQGVSEADRTELLDELQFSSSELSPQRIKEIIDARVKAMPCR